MASGVCWAFTTTSKLSAKPPTQPRPRASLRALNPDLIFLDVEMPGGDGFAVLQQLDDVPITIFTTAYDGYAVRSFEADAPSTISSSRFQRNAWRRRFRARKTFARLS